MTSRGAVLALTALAACGGGSAGGAAPGSVSPAHRSHGAGFPPVMYRAGAPERYAYYRRDSVVTHLPNGSDVPQVLGRSLLLTLTILPATPGTAGGLHVSIRADSLTFDADASPMMQNPFSDVAGTTWTGTIGPNGALTGLTADRHSQGADLLGIDLPRILPTLPPTGAKPGDQWSDTVANQFPIQNLQVAETLTTTSAASEGTDENQIQIATTGVLTRAGANGSLTLSGSGVRGAAYTLDADGRLLAASGADTVTMDISIKAVGQSVKVQQWGRYTVTPRP